jgi:3-oxoacyl-[acyl-carrier protein] reductase
MHDLIKELRKEFGPLYGLVNNAALGTSGLLATTHDTRIENLVHLKLTR